MLQWIKDWIKTRFNRPRITYTKIDMNQVVAALMERSQRCTQTKKEDIKYIDLNCGEEDVVKIGQLKKDDYLFPCRPK